MLDYYRYVVVETYRAYGETRHLIRARPLPRQGLPITMKVECSVPMREKHPIGTKFKIRAKIKNTTEAPQLYTSWQWKYIVLTDSEAESFINAKLWNA